VNGAVSPFGASRFDTNTGNIPRSLRVLQFVLSAWAVERRCGIFSVPVRLDAVSPCTAPDELQSSDASHVDEALPEWLRYLATHLHGSDTAVTETCSGEVFAATAVRSPAGRTVWWREDYVDDAAGW